MPPLTADRLIQGARRRRAKLFDRRLVRWYRQGEYQQVWYLRRLVPLLHVDLVPDVAGNVGQFVRFHQSHEKGNILVPSRCGGHDA